MPKLADQKKDFPQWYLDVIERADLAENSEVRGCIVFKPYGYALWENMQKDMDARIKARGVDNVYFPLFIPESLMAKEAEHVEGFAPECAVVTHGGGKELAEKLYVRPTSETIIYATFAKWIHSHRDLPLKINQWANIVRWEMRTRPFLRTLEFLWQEGHTAHASKEGADEMAEDILKMYSDFDREALAIPVLTGMKPDHDKFAGALYTLATEALAKDGKAIQAGTSHNLGQGFSEAYDVSYLDEKEKEQRPWMTSWGVSTRLIGTLIVVHGDEKGMRIPPSIAPIQIAIVPIYKSDEEKENVISACKDLVKSLKDIRVKLDDREEKSPGFKFNEWEVKGVPIRVEVGPKDLEKDQVVIVRRDTGAKEMIKSKDFDKKKAKSILDSVQKGLFEQAQKFVEDNTHEAKSMEDLQKILDEKGGFVWAPWEEGDIKSANQIQSKTKATVRLVGEGDKKGMGLFAKAY